METIEQALAVQPVVYPKQLAAKLQLTISECQRLFSDYAKMHPELQAVRLKIHQTSPDGWKIEKTANDTEGIIYCLSRLSMDQLNATGLRQRPAIQPLITPSTANSHPVFQTKPMTGGLQKPSSLFGGPPKKTLSAPPTLTVPQSHVEKTSGNQATEKVSNNALSFTKASTASKKQATKRSVEKPPLKKSVSLVAAAAAAVTATASDFVMQSKESGMPIDAPSAVESVETKCKEQQEEDICVVVNAEILEEEEDNESATHLKTLRNRPKIINDSDDDEEQEKKDGKKSDGANSSKENGDKQSLATEQQHHRYQPSIVEFTQTTASASTTTDAAATTIVNKRKRRVQRKRMYKDAWGKMVTELVDEYETCSDQEDNENNAPSSISTNTTSTKSFNSSIPAAKAKKTKLESTGGKRQGSLLQFFGPKTT